MRFADPQACPDCRGQILGNDRCPHCHLDLTSLEVRQLWQTLQRADELLATAVRRRDEHRAVDGPAAPVAPAPSPGAVAPPPEPREPWTPQAYPAPASSAPAKPPRRISAGAVLLGLGAFGMVVAGFIFLTVNWGSLGVAGRALVMLLFTALVGAAAAWATRRPLRGSAEAVWTIFLAMATLDWFVACHQGLLGLDALSLRGTLIVWAAAISGLGALIVRKGRRSVGADLVAPMAIAGAASILGACAVAVEAQARGANAFWSTVVAMLLSAAAAAAFHRLRLRVAVALAGVFALLGLASAVTLAIAEVFEHPSLRELTAEGHAVPMLIVMVSLIVVGAVIPQITMWAGASAAGAAVLLVAVPAQEAWPDRGALVVAAATVVLIALLPPGQGAWLRGARVCAGALGAGLAFVMLVRAVEVLEAAAEGVNEAVRSAPWDAAAVGVAGRSWLIVVVTAALVVLLTAARRWSEVGQIHRHLLPAALVTAAIGVVTAVGAAEPAYVVTAAVMMAVSVALAAALDRFGLPWQLIPVAGVAGSLGAALTHEVGSCVMWAVGAMALAVMTSRITDPVCRDVTALAAAATAVGALSFVLDAVGASTVGWGLGYVLAAASLSAIAFTLRGRRGNPVELVAAVTLLAGLLLAAGGSAAVARAAVFVLAALLLLALSLFAGRDADAWRGIDRSQVYRSAGVVATVCAMFVALPQPREALGFWVAGAAIVAVVSWRAPESAERRATALVAAGAVTGAVLVGLELAGATAEESSLVLVVTAALLCAGGAIENAARRLPIECAAGATAVLGVAAALASSSLAWVAVVLTVLGGLAGLVSLLGAGAQPVRQQVYRAVAAGALGTAYILRLAASEVGVVEAYTLPFGFILLAAGVWMMRQEAGASSTLALGPALTLILLPSLPQALADPTSLRAVLLGGAALLALVTGSARNLRAPFVLGGVVFAMIVLVNIGPYAAGLPRWTLIAAASALLLGAGITWEDRVRDGRAALRYVTAMR